MAIVPTGAPAWVRNAEYSTYGGHTSKINYQGQGKVNARTDVDAAEFSRMVADLAAVVRTAPFCTITFTARDASVLDPMVNAVVMQTGTTAVAYAGNTPPAGFPSVTRVADGNYLITVDASYLDPYGVSGAYQPVHAVGNGHGASGLDVTTVIGVSTVQTYVTFGGAAAPDEKVTVAFW